MVSCAGFYYRVEFQGFLGCGEGDPLSPKKIKFGGRCSVTTLDFVCGRVIRKKGQVGKGVTTPCHLFKCGYRTGHIDGPGISTGLVLHPDQDI